MLRFLRQFSAFALVQGLLLFALHKVYGPALIHPLTGQLFGYMALLTLFIYQFTARLVAASLAILGGIALVITGRRKS